MAGPNLWILRIDDVSMMVPERRVATVFEHKGTEIVGARSLTWRVASKRYKH